MRFHVVCPYEMVGEYEDSDGVRVKVYRCALCGRAMERRSVFGRVAKEMGL